MEEIQIYVEFYWKGVGCAEDPNDSGLFLVVANILEYVCVDGQ